MINDRLKIIDVDDQEIPGRQQHRFGKPQIVLEPTSLFLGLIRGPRLPYGSIAIYGRGPDV